MGLELAVMVLLGGLLGFGVDHWLGSAPLFLLGGLVGGMVVGLWQLARMQNRKN